jgi:hypothetical protein
MINNLHLGKQKLLLITEKFRSKTLFKIGNVSLYIYVIMP